MKRRLLELGKDILIVLLTLALLVLTLLAVPTRTLSASPWLSAALGPFAELLGLSRAELTYTEKATAGLDAAQPLAISVRNSAGRYSAQYDPETLNGLYETLGSTLGQALESAGAREETTLQKLYAAMGGVGVSFLYPAELPSGVLASWLDAQPQESGESASFYVLSVQEDGTVRLYLRGSACWVCETALSGESLLQMLDGYRPDGSLFALEDGTGVYSRLDPCSLIPADTPVIYEASVQIPTDMRMTTTLASVLGFNPYGDASYTDAEGNAFFSETDASLRISSDGKLVLSAEEGASRFSAQETDAGSRIEAARALLAQISAEMTTQARLSLSGFTETEAGAVCTFDYSLNGVPVLQRESGHAATVVFTGRTMTELTLLLHTYTAETQTISLIPAAQAAAIVPGGTMLRVCYDDTGAGVLGAGWMNG